MHTGNQEPPDVPNTNVGELQRRLAFLELRPEDGKRLRQLASSLSGSTTDFVKAFYAHLLSFADTARFLQDPALVERLKVTQREHLQSMLEADWNDRYIERRRNVGDAHAQIGISPDIFLGAYVQYLKHCLGVFAAQHDLEVRRLLEQVLSLLKAVFLDIGLTLDAYFEQAMQKLMRALDMVVKANAELRQFAHLTSHDLKTPLATVANLCDETLDEFGGNMPAEAVRLIHAARDRVFRMSTSIDELLASTVRTLEEGAREEFSVVEMIDELLAQLAPDARSKEIEIIVQCDLPLLAADRVRTREALYNIISNAIKFIDKRPGRILIEGRTGHGEYTLSVADNGPGIPREELSRIFMPFYRLRAQQGVTGSGLGLYFTRSLIERQGGRVWAESVPGEGTCFYIALPYCAPPTTT
jgi:signal transduction histidine kinase